MGLFRRNKHAAERSLLEPYHGFTMKEIYNALIRLCQMSHDIGLTDEEEAALRLARYAVADVYNSMPGQHMRLVILGNSDTNVVKPCIMHIQMGDRP